jgi:hypothetical protein
MRTPFRNLRLVIYIGDIAHPVSVEPAQIASDPAKGEAIVKLTSEQAHVLGKAWRDLEVVRP